MVLTIVNYFLDYLGYQLEPLPSSTSSSHEDQKRKVQVELGQRKKRRSSVDARSRESSGEARSSKWNLWEPNINFAGKDIVLVKESNDASQELEENNPEKIISLSDSFQQSLSLDAPSASPEQITTIDSGDEDIKQDVILVSEVHYSTKDVTAEDDTRAATPEVAVEAVEDEDKTSPLTDRTNTSSDALVSEVHYTTTQHRTPTKECFIKKHETEVEEIDCKASEVEKSKEMPGAESLKLNKASDDQDPGASSQNKKQGKENSRSYKGQGNNRNKNRSSGSKAKNKRKGF